jgi:hypothetical protein
MSRIAALFVGIAALGVISAVAKAEDDGCGRGWYYDGRGCVPLNQPGYYPPPPPPPPPPPDYYPPPPPAYYLPPPGYDYEAPVERGPQLRFDPGFQDDDEARYFPPNPNFKTWNNCAPNFTVQDGLCKPYRGG